MNRTDILNALATTLGLKRYLEIGVRNPADNFDKIVCEERTGVDRRCQLIPSADRPWEFAYMTSDQFFFRHPTDQYFDLVLIDGSHVAEQVRRDVENALWHSESRPNARIVMHDCNPPDEKHTHGSLCGTAYQVFIECCKDDPTLSCCCVDCDYGVGIIQRAGGTCAGKRAYWHGVPYPYTYADLAAHRAEWLNLISPEDWRPN